MKTILWLLVAALALAACTTRSPRVAAAPLTGGTWVAEDVDGGGMVDGARVSIAFGADRASSRSGCNNFTGSYAQSGSRLTFGPLAGTRMMCPPALMTLEGKVLAILGSTRTYRSDASGALVVTAADGRTIRFRREP